MAEAISQRGHAVPSPHSPGGRKKASKAREEGETTKWEKKFLLSEKGFSCLLPFHEAITVHTQRRASVSLHTADNFGHIKKFK